MDILLPFYMGLLSAFMPFILIGIGALVLLGIIFLFKLREYKNSSYYKATGLSYFSVRFNKGRIGEYLTYKHLKDYEKLGARFLFNVYVPKENGETSEIDVLMLSPKGIFVFESKNYSGWIFGSESQRNWYQTLPTGRGRSHKEHFYNPIMQNRSHIKHLNAFIGDFPTNSVIVFSERCTLKSVTVSSENIKVIKRGDILGTVNGIYRNTAEAVLSAEDICMIYEKLYPLTQVSDDVKAQHIESINNKQSGKATASEADVPVISESTEAKPNDIVPTVTEEASCTITEVGTIGTPEGEVLKCPRCGGELILRTASKGANAGRQFYGCSNFPKCRYVQSL